MRRLARSFLAVATCVCASALAAATVSKPTLSPAPGTYSGSVSVTISSGTKGSTIRYTIDGNDPTSKSATYTSPITITTTTTLKAKAFKTGMSTSSATSGKYTVEKKAKMTAAITATEPVIPTGSALKGGSVKNRCVQYRSEVTGTVSAGKPQAGVKLRFASDRGSDDTITQPASPTNANGTATGRITTFRQGTAKISDDNADIDTSSTAAISFRQADWESRFSMTGYILANEADYGPATIKNPCGLTGTWRREFLYGSTSLGGVLMQGSGRDLKGNIITIDWKKSGSPLSKANVCFTIAKCATTASGACATAGTTIAVDPTVVPLTASVTITGTGSRVAEDTGGAIKGYRIDVFRGFGKAAMKGWGNYSGGVRYLSGGGTCN